MEEGTIKNITEKEEEAHHHLHQALPAEVVIAVALHHKIIREKADQGQEIKERANGTNDFKIII